MAIPGNEIINVGLPNEAAGSDSLYEAFTKTRNNFQTLFGNSSPYNTFTGNTGIQVTANSTAGTLDIKNVGVTSIIAGTGIVLDTSTGNVTISSTGGGGNGGGTVTSVGLVPASTGRLTVASSPITSSGVMTIDLAMTGVTPGTYTYPTVTVDNYGRITTIDSATAAGTVTSVGIATTGTGLQISGSPITTNGTINIVNTGVTRLTAGTGISLSSSNGNVTVSSTSLGGTVTSVAVSSSTLTVTNSPVITSGTITVDLPANVSITGQLLLNNGENLANGAAANLAVTASYFTTTGASTATLAAGTAGQIKTFMMVADGGDMVITVTNAGWKTSGTGTITFNDIGDGVTLQYMNNKWYCIGNNGAVFG